MLEGSEVEILFDIWWWYGLGVCVAEVGRWME